MTLYSQLQRRVLHERGLAIMVDFKEWMIGGCSGWAAVTNATTTLPALRVVSLLASAPAHLAKLTLKILLLMSDRS